MHFSDPKKHVVCGCTPIWLARVDLHFGYLVWHGDILVTSAAIFIPILAVTCNVCALTNNVQRGPQTARSGAISRLQYFTSLSVQTSGGRCRSIELQKQNSSCNASPGLELWSRLKVMLARSNA